MGKTYDRGHHRSLHTQYRVHKVASADGAVRAMGVAGALSVRARGVRGAGVENVLCTSG